MKHAKHCLSALLGLALFPLNSLAESLAIGVAPGPEAQVMGLVRDIAARDGLDLTIVVYPDTGQLNADLATGKLDANSFQNPPALEAETEAQRYPLAQAAYTLSLPLGFYSKRIKSFRELGEGSQVALPKDAALRGRALILLHNYGLIRVADTAGLRPDSGDIVSNPRRLSFIQVDAASAKAALADAAVVALAYPIATQAGLSPIRDGLGAEDSHCPFAHILAIRAGDRNKPWVAKLVRAYHSGPVKAFILSQYQGAVGRPW